MHHLLHDRSCRVGKTEPPSCPDGWLGGFCLSGYMVTHTRLYVSTVSLSLSPPASLMASAQTFGCASLVTCTSDGLGLVALVGSLALSRRPKLQPFLSGLVFAVVLRGVASMRTRDLLGRSTCSAPSTMASNGAAWSWQRSTVHACRSPSRHTL